ncbi:MAG: antirestriction protein ArdA [Mangrovicoccus sp.]
MTATLHAQPYDITANGFYFESFDDYQAKAQAALNDFGDPVEEFEIQFIDGETIDAQLFLAWGVHQGDIAAYLDAVEDWDDHDKTKAIIALREGLAAFNPAQDHRQDLDVDLYYVDTMEELAEQFLDEGLFGDIPTPLQYYIDTAAIARDLAMDYTMIYICNDRLAYRAD